MTVKLWWTLTEELMYFRIICLKATLPTINPNQTGLGSNPHCYAEMPVLLHEAWHGQEFITGRLVFKHHKQRWNPTNISDGFQGVFHSSAHSAILNNTESLRTIKFNTLMVL
jgi:hypothetical protein